MRTSTVLYYLVALVAVGVVVAVWAGFRTSSAESFPSLQCGNVDVVYTWVNGSDPVHLKQLARFKESSVQDGRFRDYDTLRYSLRSVRRYFPVARWIHIVVADNEALPSWLASDHDGIRIVRHSEIMPESALPTFNSNAIETNLHLIPNLAECFLYLNDDMLLGRTVDLSHFYDSHSHRMRVHLGSWVAPFEERIKEANLWHVSIAASNARLDKVFGFPGIKSRRYPLHGCYFFHKKIFAHMRKVMKVSFARTLHQRLRSEKDNVVSFLYPHIAQMDFGAQEVSFQLYYAALSSSLVENWEFLKFLVRRRPLCACINDALSDSVDQQILPELQLHRAMHLLYPNAAPWEISAPNLEPFDETLFTADSWLATLLKLAVGGPIVSVSILLISSFVVALMRCRL